MCSSVKTKHNEYQPTLQFAAYSPMHILTFENLNLASHPLGFSIGHSTGEKCSVILCISCNFSDRPPLAIVPKP